MEVEKKEGLNGHLMLIHLGTDNRRTDFYNGYLDKLIKTLERKGYTFVPVLEAIGIKIIRTPLTPKKGKFQIKPLCL